MGDMKFRKMLQVQSPTSPLHPPLHGGYSAHTAPRRIPTSTTSTTTHRSRGLFGFRSHSAADKADKKKKMASHDQFILKVTAGPEYDFATHHTVNVNTDKSVHISTDDIEADIDVRIQKYRGLPQNSPDTAPYFSSATHKSDLYSIAFSFTPKHDINGNDLLFGNDFDHPIRDRLPPGFSYAFKLVKWMIDPGLEGDPYADEPYLYGTLLGSINVLNVGPKPADPEAEKKVNADDEGVLKEGSAGNGESSRKDSGMPDDGTARRKYFTGSEEHRKNFVFEKGRRYSCDFFNPYLDFNEFTLRLPGFSLPIVKHWNNDELRDHSLRYVLRDRKTNKLLFCLVFTLVPTDEAKKEDAKQREQDDTTAKASTPPRSTPGDDVD